MKFFILTSFLFSFSALCAPLFESESILEVKLSYDIAKLQAEKEDLRETGLAGKLTQLSTNLTLPVEVLTRGNGSFDCTQPQLRLKFDESQTQGTVFSRLKKVKLFTKGVCLENKTDPEQDKQILANYLIYKLYEEMTHYSFRTRLLKIHYTDTSGTYPDYTQLGFLLEPNNVIEKRLKLKNIDEVELLQLADRIVPRLEMSGVKRVNAFQLMIANYDYGIPGLFSHIINDSGYPGIYYGEKNSKIYEDQNGVLIPFIYDFDLSRFAYLGPQCTFGIPFFIKTISENLSCTLDYLLQTLDKDLSMFHFKDDFNSEVDSLVNALKTWESKQRMLIDLLGPEYNEGLSNFIKLMELKQQR